MKSHTKFILMPFIVLLCCICENISAQLAVNASSNYVQLMDSFTLSGINVSNITYSGNASACGYFSNGSTTNLGISSGIVLSTGNVSSVVAGPSNTASSDLLASGNALLTQLTGGATYDAAVLEFDFVPNFDTLSLSYVYASEDYPEWVGGSPQFQDHIGAFITGTNPSGGNYSNQNLALVPNTALPVLPNNINDTTNAQNFVSNTSGSIIFDGFTTLLSIKIPVVPSTSYHMTIGISDGGDASNDSGIFLKSHSLSSYGNTTGIPEPDRQDLFQFFPNPATDKIIFTSSENGILTITNQLGQFADGVSITANQTQISTANLSSGIYYLTLQTERNIITRKLAVQQ